MRWLDPLLRFLVSCLPFLAGSAVAAPPAVHVAAVEVDVELEVELPADALSRAGEWALADLDVEVELELPADAVAAWVDALVRGIVEDPRGVADACAGGALEAVLDRVVGTSFRSPAG